MEEGPDMDSFIVAEEIPSDADSAYGQSEEASSASITSSILAFKEENGRRYHALSAGKYALPNDEAENERLDLQHYMFLLTLGSELALSPKAHGARRVLDVGTGTGIWAIDYAENSPASEVLGVDLSPIQPEFVPPNCSFEIDDLEKAWTWSDPFDFIFMRMVLGSFQDFPALVKTAYENLEPNGYLEIQDLSLHVRSDDGTLPQKSSIIQWADLIHDAASRAGRPVFPCESYKQYMLDAGFVDVEVVIRKWPTNQWPRDKHYKDLGAFAYTNLGGGLDGLTMAHFTRAFGWSKEEVIAYCAGVRKEMRDFRVHAWWPIFFVWGRKPAPGEFRGG